MKPTSQPTSRFALWRSAGIWVGVLALGLLAVGLILSFEQAQVLALSRIEAERHHGMDLVGRIHREVNSGVRTAFILNRAMELHGSPEQDEPSSTRDRPVAWIEAVVLWNGRQVVRVSGPPERDRTCDARIAVALEARRLAGGTDVPDPTTQPEHPPPGPSKDAEVPVLYDDLGNDGILLASMRTQDAEGLPTVIAAVIDKRSLRGALIEPLMGVGTGLELVTEFNTDALWYVPLGMGLKFWAVQPSAAFIQEQRAAGTRLTLVYGLVTVPALVAVLLMLWLMFRLARREMALSQMKSDFVADVSHELRTPLALIQLFGETLLEGRVRSEEKRQEYYDVIMRESTRLTHLIDNLLDFSRIEAGGKEYELSPHDVGAVIRETYEDYHFELDHHGFEHTINVAESLPRVEMDREAVAQAIVNLMGNAIKYSDDDRFLGIDVEPDTRRGTHGVLISVHDRGIGIKPEDRSHIFDGFFRASDRRVRDRRGTGLGLALVKHIVDEHKGTIWVESRLVKGSTFRIFLPAAADAAEGARERA